MRGWSLLGCKREDDCVNIGWREIPLLSDDIRCVVSSGVSKTLCVEENVTKMIFTLSHSLSLSHLFSHEAVTLLEQQISANQTTVSSKINFSWASFFQGCVFSHIFYSENKNSRLHRNTSFNHITCRLFYSKFGFNKRNIDSIARGTSA